jgi:AcrR family transcriptional regulator
MAQGSNAPEAQIRRLRSNLYSEAILDAAERCFFESGFAETKMAEVASRAGVAVGTVYKYFTSKEALLAALAVRHRELLLQALEEVRTIEDPIARLYSAVERGLSIAEGGGALFAVYLQLQGVVESQIQALGGIGEEETRDRFQRTIAEAYREGVERGVLRPDVAIERFAGTLCAAVNLEMRSWAQGSRTDSLTERGRAVLDLLLNGAMP